MAASAKAQSIVQTAAQWGLIGDWQTDCNKSPTRENETQRYVARDGKLFLSRYDGKSDEYNPITSATINANGEIEVVVTFIDTGGPQVTRLNVHAKDSQGRERIMQNKDVATGKFSVKDGTLLHNGAATKWLTRCR